MQDRFVLKGRNPDVLTCIANLSNDEVFTPPVFANRMLDTVAAAWAADHGGADIWANPDVRFLDPCTKSGVFLREITQRLIRGLESQIPNLQERVDHILMQQVFGIGSTQLTSLMARRSVYCSKYANSQHSVTRGFSNEAGNVWFERTEHTWNGQDRCKFCGASKTSYGRGESLETYAYAFIHTDNIKVRTAELFGADMQFDVIIGNPPYQLGSDGGTRDVPIYQKFVDQAKHLQPRYLSMVIPARWMATGLGLSEFRKDMLADRRLRQLVDYPVAKEVFAGVEVKGGVCYFLWDSNHDADCMVTLVRGGAEVGPTGRDLGEFDVFVRDARALSILRKVRNKNDQSINKILSADKEFGWTSNFDGFSKSPSLNSIPIYYVRKGKRDIGFIDRAKIQKSANLADVWKVLIPSAGSDASSVPDYVLSSPVIAPSPSVCTQTYLFFAVNSERQANSLRSFLATKFCRFLISLRKITQHATRSTYEWVPMQEWDRMWDDESLFSKYDLTEEEISFIETQIRSVDWGR